MLLGRAPVAERHADLAHPVMHLHAPVLVLVGVGARDERLEQLAGAANAARAQLAPGQRGGQLHAARIAGLRRQALDRLAQERHRAAVFAAAAEDATPQRQQRSRYRLHAQLGVHLFGLFERAERAVIVAALGRDLRQRLAAGGLVRPVREALRRGQPLFGRAPCLGQLAQLGEEVGQVRQVERRARRAGAAHLGQRRAQLHRGFAKAALGGVRHRQVVNRGHQQLAIFGSAEQPAHLVEDANRRLVLAEIEVRRGLGLQQARANLERGAFGARQAALGEPQHLLVLAAHVQQTSQPGERLTLPLARPAGARTLERLLVETMRLVPVAGHALRFGERQQQWQLGVHALARQVGQRLEQRGRASLAQQCGRQLAGQPRGVVGAPCQQVVLERALTLATRFQRGGGLGIQRCEPGGAFAALELLAHHAAHQLVTFVRGMTAAAEAAHQATTRQRFEQRRRLPRAGQRHGQIGVEARQR